MPRYNLQIKVTSHTGNATDDTTLAGVGFRPMLAICKGANSSSGVWKTNLMILRDIANLLTSTASSQSDRIQELLNDGMQIGANAAVNTNSTKYYDLYIRGTNAQSYFRTFRYYGNGADSRDMNTLGLNFTPDWVFFQASTTGTAQAITRTSEYSGDGANHLSGAAVTNLIQSFISGGFQLGSNAATNSNGIEYQGWAMKNIPGVFKVMSYTGTGVARSIDGLGFKPDWLLIKNRNTADVAVLYTKDMVTDVAGPYFVGTGGVASNSIASLDSDGFSVGTAAAVNGSGNTIDVIAIKSGNFNVPISRTVL